jgi:hypothetical protein
VAALRTCASVSTNSTVIETYCGIGDLLLRNRGDKILKIFLKGAK